MSFLSPFRPSKRLLLALAASGLAGAMALVAESARRTARRLLHPPRRPFTQTPTDYGLPYEDVTFVSRDGTRLAGWFIPGHTRAAVAIVHGAWVNREGLLFVAEWLNRRGGLNVLLFDLRGGGESDGDTVTFGYHERADLLGAVDYLGYRPEIDAQRVGAYGSSIGAAVALLAAADGLEVAAVVADSPYTNLEELIGRSFRAFTGLPAFPFAPLVVRLAEWETGLRAAEVAPLEVIHRISPRPVFLIHGENDDLIPHDDSRQLYAAAGEPRALWVVPGAGHTRGHATAREEYEERVVAFFHTWLIEPPYSLLPAHHPDRSEQLTPLPKAVRWGER